MMNTKLFFQAITKFVLGVVIVGVLIFVPAGTLNYLQGWILLAILFLPMFVVGIFLMTKNPNLLQKRLDAKEKQKEQRRVLVLCGLLFVVVFVFAGLNYRFGWLVLPIWISILASVGFAVSYIVYGVVLMQNEYLSRRIEVQQNQKVIESGLYAIVRHPMYTSTIFLFVSIPLILGCLFSAIIMLLYIPIIVVRIKNEEKLLEEKLNGYKEYKQKVKYRLIPFVW